MTCSLNTRGSARTYVGKRELVQQTRREHARIRPGAPPALTVPALRHRPNLHRGPVPAHLDDAREHALSVDQGEQLAALEDEDPGSVLTILSNASWSSEATSSRALSSLSRVRVATWPPFARNVPGGSAAWAGVGNPAKGQSRAVVLRLLDDSAPPASQSLRGMGARSASLSRGAHGSTSEGAPSKSRRPWSSAWTGWWRLLLFDAASRLALPERRAPNVLAG